jgi:glycosyltransferase involved in cell wall biosynthesis
MRDRVSIVMTLHTEGLLAHYALSSLIRVRAAAEQAGLATELICVLDCADADTRNIAGHHACLRESDSLIEVRHGDPGASRNSGLARAQGDFVAFLDGDDHCSKDWLHRAHREVVDCPRAAVCHPEWVLSFGEFHSLMRINDQRRAPYPLASLFKHHPWINAAFGRRETYDRARYVPPLHRETGFAYEDWHLNLELLSLGCLHITAPDTALYYRRKKNSTLVSHNALRSIVRPTRFFDKPEQWASGFATQPCVVP